MKKLKFIINNKKKHKLKKIYILKLSNFKKTIKIDRPIILSRYIPNIKLYIFIYSIIIPSLKLGYSFSKLFYLLSLFYVKNFLRQNLN